VLTQLELNALAQLLQRTPMTQAEFLKAQDILAKLQAEIQALSTESESEPTEPEA